MVTMRRAHVGCPKCGHRFTVRDNGGLSKENTDKVWAAFDKTFIEMDKAFRSMDRMFKKLWK